MENIPSHFNAKKTDFSFKKEEHLCSKKVIDKIFAEGEMFLSYPLKIIYLKSVLPAEYPVQAAFTVSKKKFKIAVQRNLIKRRMREAYRLNKHVLFNKTESNSLAVFFVFIGKEIQEYNVIEAAMKKGLKRLINECYPEK